MVILIYHENQPSFNVAILVTLLFICCDFNEKFDSDSVDFWVVLCDNSSMCKHKLFN